MNEKTVNMGRKRRFFTEAAYLIGIIVLAAGTAFTERADFGMSTVVAPAYILHLKLSEYFSFFSFGMAEYVLQAVLIVVLALIHRKVKRIYLVSFGTAVLYGFALDLAIMMVSWFPYDTIGFRVLYYAVGLLLCPIGVSLLFNTYISPEAYEVFVKEISAKLNIPISRFKTIYDCSSCVIAIILSFVFFGFGKFEGIKLGTVICALLNGWLIGIATRIFEHFFVFCDGLPLRKHIEK